MNQVTLGHADCAQLLLDCGANANHQDKKGRTYVIIPLNFNLNDEAPLLIVFFFVFLSQSGVLWGDKGTIGDASSFGAVVEWRWMRFVDAEQSRRCGTARSRCVGSQGARLMALASIFAAAAEAESSGRVDYSGGGCTPAADGGDSSSSSTKRCQRCKQRRQDTATRRSRQQQHRNVQGLSSVCLLCIILPF